MHAPQPQTARITTFGNLKGGSGKTTNAVNTAGVLAAGKTAFGTQRVLLVDLEPLRTASEWLNCRAGSPTESSSALFLPAPTGAAEVEAHRAAIRALPQRVQNEPFDIIPGHEKSLQTVDDERGEEFDLADNLAVLAPSYDHIILDLPGSRTGRLVRSALVASHGVVIPVQPGAAAVTSSMKFFRLIDEMRRAQNRDLSIDGLLLSASGSKSDTDAMITREALQGAFPHHVFAARIRTLKATLRCADFNITVATMGNREALEDFVTFVEEWGERIGRLPVPRANGRRKGDA